SGVYKTTLGSYAPGDRLRVAVEGQTVRYYWNGVLSYTSSVTPVLPLIADTSLYQTGSTILNLVMSGAPATDPPTLSPGAGTYGEPTSVTAAATAGATIRYTTDGSDPSSSSPPHTGPIAVNATVTPKARALQQGSESRTVTATYVVVPPTEGGDRPVVFTNASGVFVNGNSLNKTATTTSWDAGAASKEVIRDGYGYVEF